MEHEEERGRERERQRDRDGIVVPLNRNSFTGLLWFGLFADGGQPDLVSFSLPKKFGFVGI